jgi:nucleotide-binding universal stress UspA family protein
MEANRLHQWSRRETAPRKADILVLFGTEGRLEDDDAIRTLATSRGMFDPERVRLRIIHVETVPMTAPLDVPLPQAAQESARILRHAQVVAGMAGMAAETAILRGRSVAEALVDDARRSRASAIVVRLRSRETVGAHVLLSLTVRRLLKNAPCPVIIVHLPHVKGTGDVGEGRPHLSKAERPLVRSIQTPAGGEVHARLPSPRPARGSRP